MVFWGYDVYPYLLSGTLRYIDESGYAYAEEYNRMRFKPKFNLPYASGLQLKKGLDELTAERRKKIREVEVEYEKKLEELLLKYK